MDGVRSLLLRSTDGAVRVLDSVTGLLVGVDDSTHRETLEVEAPRGSTLIAYTDGLIERPGVDLDEGIRELCDRIADAPPGGRRQPSGRCSSP